MGLLDQRNTRSDLTAMIWKDKREVYMLPSMHNRPSPVNMGLVDKAAIQGNFFSVPLDSYVL
jgi:hypothetical protein